MRKQLAECKTKLEAYELYPWASVVVKAEGGWMCFESYTDYHIWINQK